LIKPHQLLGVDSSIPFLGIYHFTSPRPGL
jgi:hypothetical protein